MLKHGRRSKFGAVLAPSADGCRLYASTAERDRGQELRLLAQAGAIAELEEQPPIALTPTITYRPDFTYLEADGRRVYEDVKGVETEAFSLKRRLWALGLGPAVLRIVKRAKRSRAFVVTREVHPGTWRLVDGQGTTIAGPAGGFDGRSDPYAAPRGVK